MSLSACQSVLISGFLCRRTIRPSTWIRGWRGILWWLAVASCLWYEWDLPSSASGSAARYEALERTCARNWMNSCGRSLTTMMPSEDGPKASVSVSKETVPVQLEHECSQCKPEGIIYHFADLWGSRWPLGPRVLGWCSWLMEMRFFPAFWYFDNNPILGVG